MLFSGSAIKIFFSIYHFIDAMDLAKKKKKKYDILQIKHSHKDCVISWTGSGSVPRAQRMHVSPSVLQSLQYFIRFRDEHVLLCSNTHLKEHNFTCSLACSTAGSSPMSILSADVSFLGKFTQHCVTWNINYVCTALNQFWQGPEHKTALPHTHMAVLACWSADWSRLCRLLVILCVFARVRERHCVLVGSAKNQRWR